MEKNRFVDTMYFISNGKQRLTLADQKKLYKLFGYPVHVRRGARYQIVKIDSFDVRKFVEEFAGRLYATPMAAAIWARAEILPGLYVSVPFTKVEENSTIY